MKRSIIISWRDPIGNMRDEQFDAEKFKVHTEAGWLKLTSNEAGGIIRIIPSTRVGIVQFIEEPEESKVLKPTLMPPGPKFQPS